MKKYTRSIPCAYLTTLCIALLTTLLLDLPVPLRAAQEKENLLPDRITFKSDAPLPGFAAGQRTIPCRILWLGEDYIQIDTSQWIRISSPQTLPRKQIASIDRDTTGSLEFSQLQNLIQLPNQSAPPENYQPWLKKLKTFIAEYPKSPLLADARQLLDSIENEILQIRKGQFRIDDQWYPNEQKEAVLSHLKSRQYLAHIEAAAENNDIYPFYELARRHREFSSTGIYPEILKKLKSSISLLNDFKLETAQSLLKNQINQAVTNLKSNQVSLTNLLNISPPTLNQPPSSPENYINFSGKWFPKNSVFFVTRKKPSSDAPPAIEMDSIPEAMRQFASYLPGNGQPSRVISDSITRNLAESYLQRIREQSRSIDSLKKQLAANEAAGELFNEEVSTLRNELNSLNPERLEKVIAATTELNQNLIAALEKNPLTDLTTIRSTIRQHLKTWPQYPPLIELQALTEFHQEKFSPAFSAQQWNQIASMNPPPPFPDSETNSTSPYYAWLKRMISAAQEKVSTSTRHYNEALEQLIHDQISEASESLTAAEASWPQNPLYYDTEASTSNPTNPSTSRIPDWHHLIDLYKTKAWKPLEKTPLSNWNKKEQQAIHSLIAHAKSQMDLSVSEMTRFQQAIDSHASESAAMHLTKAKEIWPKNPKLSQAETELEKARKWAPVTAVTSASSFRIFLAGLATLLVLGGIAFVFIRKKNQAPSTK